MRKVLLILSIIMAFEASAACDEEGYFDCGTTGDVKWYVSNDQKTLTVSGNGAMGNYSYTDISPNGDGQGPFLTTAPWKDYASQVENIVVSEGVTSVGNWAFGYIQNVTNVSLPDTLTTIGKQAFRNLPKLTNIELPNSLVSIGNDAFLSDTGLTDIIIPDSVQTIGSMAFYNDKGLQSVIVPDSVVSIGSSAFGNNGDGHSLNRNIAGNVYCEQPAEGKSPCENGNLGLPQNRFKTYQKRWNKYLVDGAYYDSLSDMVNQQNATFMKRIYTVKEASEVASKKNSVIIRYK